MRTPSISFCVPCFNSAGTLHRVLAALQAQPLPLSAALVIDDGSEDSTAQFAASSGVRVIRHERNLGRGAVRARAIEELSSDLILFCDASIAMAPDFLERALPHFQSEATSAVFGRVVQAEASTPVQRWRGRHLFKGEAAQALDRRASLATGAVLLKREGVRSVGNFDPALRAGEDADLGRRLLAAGHLVVFDPSIVSAALGTNTLMQTLERYARWNTAPGERIRTADYLRLISHAIKVMAREDLRRCDLASACISLICPHYQFWRTRFRQEKA